MTDNYLTTNSPITQECFDSLIDDIKNTETMNFDPKMLSNLLLLCYHCALKKGELIALKISDVLEENTIKNEIEIGGYRIELGLDTKELLNNHIQYLQDNEFEIQPSSPLFPYTNKKCYNSKTLQNHLGLALPPDIGLNEIRKLAVCSYYENLKNTGFPPGECLKKTRIFARHKDKRSIEQLLRDQIQQAGKPSNTQGNVLGDYLKKLDIAEFKYNETNGQTTEPLEEILNELDKETRLNSNDKKALRKQIEYIKKSTPEPRFESEDESEKSYESLIDIVKNYGKSQNSGDE